MGQHVRNYDSMTSFTFNTISSMCAICTRICFSAINPEENLQNLFTLSICCNKIPLCPKIRSDHIKLHDGIMWKYPEYKVIRLIKENDKIKNCPCWFCQNVLCCTRLGRFFGTLFVFHFQAQVTVELIWHQRRLGSIDAVAAWDDLQCSSGVPNPEGKIMFKQEQWKQEQ